jgi:hypothetical protein
MPLASTPGLTQWGTRSEDHTVFILQLASLAKGKKNMKATMWFKLTQAGQLDAVRQGKPGTQVQAMEGEISADQLCYFSVSPDGALVGATFHIDRALQQKFSIPNDIDSLSGLPGLSGELKLDLYPASLDDIFAAIQAELTRRSAHQAEQAAREAEYHQKWLRDTDELITQLLADPNFTGYGETPSFYSHRHPRQTEYETEVARRRKADEDAKKAAEDAKEAAKLLYISRWLAVHGSSLIQKQHREGLLCRNDVVKIIANSVLNPIGPAYEFFICGNAAHHCNFEPVKCLPQEIYANWDALSTKLPANTLYEFHVVKPCLLDEDNESEDYRALNTNDEMVGKKVYIVQVEVPAGPFTFRRKILLS